MVSQFNWDWIAIRLAMVRSGLVPEKAGVNCMVQSKTGPFSGFCTFEEFGACKHYS
jgi:hypothetical protein